MVQCGFPSHTEGIVLAGKTVGDDPRGMSLVACLGTMFLFSPATV